MAQQVAYDEENGKFVLAGLIFQQSPEIIFYKKREHNTRQKHGKEIDYANKKFLWLKAHGCPLPRQKKLDEDREPSQGETTQIATSLLPPLAPVPCK